jgi:hypothetical protein
MNCEHLEDSDVLADLGEISDLHVEQCARCRGRLPGYHQIAQWIAEAETTYAPPSDWEQRTLARVAASSVRPRRPTLAAALRLACVSLIFIIGVYSVIRMKGDAASPGKAGADQIASAALRVELIDEAGWRAAPQQPADSAEGVPSSGHPGQLLRARASVGSARYFEIRVYRSSRDLLVRCPRAGAAECPESGGPSLSWKITSVGVYQVILLTSQHPIASPRGAFDQDVAAVLDAGGRSIDVETIEVH